MGIGISMSMMHKIMRKIRVMNIKTKTLIFLIILCIIDMLIPIPIK